MDESQKDQLIGEFISKWGFSSEVEDAELKQDLLVLIGKLSDLRAPANRGEPQPMSVGGGRRIMLIDEV
jgi:hypothetical protein